MPWPPALATPPPAVCRRQSAADKPWRGERARRRRARGRVCGWVSGYITSAGARAARRALATGCGGAFPPSVASARLSVSRHQARRIAASFGSLAASIACEGGGGRGSEI